MTTRLELSGITLRLGERQVLEGLMLEIGPREIHALLGANGSGKSSLAYVIMGCEGYVPHTGRIHFDGEEISGLPIHERAQRGITLAWQEPARFEGLSVRDYLSLGRARREPGECLREVGLDPDLYLNRDVDQALSGGERKRIELACVLALQPRLAILDEPTAGVDLLSLDEITGLFSRLRRDGAAVLLITHRESVALEADQASQICGGRIVFSGAPREVVARFRGQRCLRCDGARCARD